MDSNSRKPIYTLHLFCGVGGGVLADLLLGHIPVGAVEIEAYPRKVLLARQLDGSLPRFPVWDDVCTFRSDNADCASYIQRLRGIRDRLCICGGFPCQDISCAGKGAGLDGERSGLWKEFARIIGEIRPAYVFVENSPRLAVLGGTRVVADMAGMGYVGRNGVLGTSDVGGNCEGKRMWFVAKTSAGRRVQVVRCKPRSRSAQSFRRSPVNAYPRSRIDRIRALEKVAGQPAILGSDDGLANRMDRLHATGNGQNPIVAALAWRTLSET